MALSLIFSIGEFSMLTCLATVNKEIIDNIYFIKQLLESHLKEREAYEIYSDNLVLNIESDRVIIKKESTFFSDFDIDNRTLEIVVVTTQKIIKDYNTNNIKENIVINGTWEEVKEALGEESYQHLFTYIYLKKVKSTSINSNDEDLFSHEDLMILYPEMGLSPHDVEVMESVSYEKDYYDDMADVHMSMSDEDEGAAQ